MNDGQFLRGVRQVILDKQAVIGYVQAPALWSGLKVAAAVLVALMGLVYPHSVAALCAL